jgi:hypothetical protein
LSRGEKKNGSWEVEGAADAAPAPVENVGVDQGGANVFVTEKFLHGANVVAILGMSV